MRIAPAPRSAARSELKVHAHRLAAVPIGELFGRDPTARPPAGVQPVLELLAAWRAGGSHSDVQERSH